MTKTMQTILTLAKQNLNNWIKSTYTAGGAFSIPYRTRTLEDFRIAVALNPNDKLKKLEKELFHLVESQDMYVDITKLKSIYKAVDTLNKSNK